MVQNPDELIVSALRPIRSKPAGFGESGLWADVDNDFCIPEVREKVIGRITGGIRNVAWVEGKATLCRRVTSSEV